LELILIRLRDFQVSNDRFQGEQIGVYVGQNGYPHCNSDNLIVRLQISTLDKFQRFRQTHPIQKML